MCEAITLLNGAAVTTAAGLKALVPDGDVSCAGWHHLFGDETCLCLTDIGGYLAMSSRRFKQQDCAVASIFSTWSEVDDQGRTYADAFEQVLVSEGEGSNVFRLVRRADWPHGFNGESPDTHRVSG